MVKFPFDLCVADVISHYGSWKCHLINMFHILADVIANVLVVDVKTTTGV